jgi:hypothetical protein
MPRELHGVLEPYLNRLEEQLDTRSAATASASDGALPEVQSGRGADAILRK